MTAALQPRDAKLLELRVESPNATLAELGERLGCSERTIQRRLRRPEVVAAWEAQASSSLKRAALTAGAAAEGMVLLLIAIARDKTALAPARISAASAVIAQAKDLYDLDTLARKVSEFEKQQKGSRYS